MNKKNFIKLAILSLVIGVVLLIIDYFIFHYITDTGFTTIKQDEAGKPFVTLLVGIFGVLYIFAGSFMLLVKKFLLNNE
jgi:hypothetical protein